MDWKYLDATLMGMFREEFYKFASETGLYDNLDRSKDMGTLISYDRLTQGNCMATELGPSGITTNVVSSGITVTDLTASFSASVGEPYLGRKIHYPIANVRRGSWYRPMAGEQPAVIP